MTEILKIVILTSRSILTNSCRRSHWSTEKRNGAIIALFNGLSQTEKNLKDMDQDSLQKPLCIVRQRLLFIMQGNVAGHALTSVTKFTSISN